MRTEEEKDKIRHEYWMAYRWGDAKDQERAYKRLEKQFRDEEEQERKAEQRAMLAKIPMLEERIRVLEEQLSRLTPPPIKREWINPL